MSDKLQGALSKTGEKKMTLKDYLENPRVVSSISNSLPQHMDPKRFSKIAFVTIHDNQELLKCSPLSLTSAVIKCAQIGLEPNALGHIYLIPFDNKKKGIKEVQVVIGYKGLMELARRSGNILEIYSEIVYENDEFQMTMGTDRKVYHVPFTKNKFPVSNTEERGKILGAYAVARFKDGGYQLAYLDIDEVMKRKSFSRGADSPYSPWAKHFEEMVHKTAIRKLANLLPLTSEVARSMSVDDDQDDDMPRPVDPIGDLSITDRSLAEDAVVVDTDTGEITEPYIPIAKKEPKKEYEGFTQEEEL